MKSTPPRPSASAPRAAARPARPSLQLDIQTGAGIRVPSASRGQLRRWILAALQCDATITLRFVARSEARALNAGYRGRDYAPDVLTFVYDAAQSSASNRAIAKRLQADIVLCVPVLREQARTARMPLEWRLAHLVIHGVLHAQGHDHEDDRDAQRMQAIETRVLRRFRIPDPYKDDPEPS
jgi:probable rRNA maturation factor